MTLSMNEPAPPNPDPRRRRLLWRATHRGTHENDILLGGFVARHIDTLTEGQLDALEEVLELPDADLGDWLTGRKPIPHGFDSPLLQSIRAFALDPANR